MLHEKPQEVPLHVSTALVGGDGQAVHDVPQEPIDVLPSQAPLQEWVPLGHAHAPFWQAAPPLHVTPHLPQLFGSFCTSMQAPPQFAYPVLHANEHDVPSQVSVAFGGGEAHAVQDVPHESTEVSLRQAAAHRWVPDPQVTHDGQAAHVPPWHEVPAPHAMLQAPQLPLSVPVSTHVPEHGVKPALHEIPHVVPSHVALPFAGTGQETPHAPQLEGDSLLVSQPSAFGEARLQSSHPGAQPP